MTDVCNTRSLAHLEANGALAGSADEPSQDGAGRITAVLGCFDALVSRGLIQILREDRNLRVIDTDLDPSALERVVASQAPQVAILDEANGAELTVLERLKAVQPTIGILILAHRPTVAYSMRLFAGGASCLSKELSAADILTVVRIVADGRRVFAADDGHLVERSYPVATRALTPREIEVLEYLSRGQRYAEVAHALQLGVETIRTHSAHIRDKFGVRSKQDLIGMPIPIKSETEIR